MILASLRHTTSPSSNWKRSSISYPVLMYRTCLFDVSAIRTGNFPAEFRLEVKTVRCKVTIVLTFPTNISTNRCAHTRAFLPFFLKLGTNLLKQNKLYVIGIQLVMKVIPLRFERRTHALEGRCSIQLSYGTSLRCGAKVVLFCLCCKYST